MNVAIIGAGGIGSRHLQGAAQAKTPVNIYVVDISKKALKTAQQRYAEVQHDFVENIFYINSISELPQKIDIAIIATSSLPRRKITEQLLESKHISCLILEKFLFPHLEDYDAVNDLLKKYGIKTFVNCARRLMNSYSNLKSLVDFNNIKFFTVSGTNWGLGCNGIHMLDLFAFLTGEHGFYKFDSSLLDNGYTFSKRNGYIEFTGKISGISPSGSLINIESCEGNFSPPLIYIEGSTAGPAEQEDFSLLIQESKNYVTLKRESNLYQEEKISLEILYQSQLTGLLIEQIAETGTCGLTSYGESAELHKSMLSAFLEHLKKSDPEVKSCPVT